MNRSIISLLLLAIILFSACQQQTREKIMTVTGEIDADEMGLTLPHEHVLVDFIGAEAASTPRHNSDQALNIILPEIIKLQKHGVKTFVECTPKYLARDIMLLRRLSKETGIFFLTNTGFYGARNNKFIPDSVLTLTTEEISRIWINEFESGIEGTEIKPGFIKIGVDRGDLNEFHIRLARAAGIAHKATGLVIMSHTGPATGAFQQLEILKEQGVAPDAFIWTHAQNENDLSKHVAAALMGAWISLDGFRGREGQLQQYVDMVTNLKKNNCIHRLLLSQDAGWYDPDHPDGSNYFSHTIIFEELIPALKEAGFSDKELLEIMKTNPSNAFSIKKRLISEGSTN